MYTHTHTCSYTKSHTNTQHVDIAALLIKHETCVNAIDKWGFTPLHEAAQKGRTQLCALLVLTPSSLSPHPPILTLLLRTPPTFNTTPPSLLYSWLMVLILL